MISGDWHGLLYFCIVFVWMCMSERLRRKIVCVRGEGSCCVCLCVGRGCVGVWLSVCV